MVRKSDVSQDLFSNKSVIKIKGQNDYEYKFSSNGVKNDDPFGKSSSLVLMGSSVGTEKAPSIRFS